MALGAVIAESSGHSSNNGKFGLVIIVTQPGLDIKMEIFCVSLVSIQSIELEMNPMASMWWKYMYISLLGAWLL